MDIEEQKQPADDKIAVLIDYENVGLTTIQSLFDRVSGYGRITLKRAYADWSNANNSRDQILELGIDPVYVFRSPSRGKNASDIKLAIDAIELLFTSDIDVFVIVSSDSDFVPLVNKLRSSGKKVYVAGDKSKVLDTLKISCTEFFEIEQSKDVQPVDKEPEKKAKKPSTPKKVKQTQTANKPQIDNADAQRIDQAWSTTATTSGQSISGPKAVMHLVRILNIDKLKTSPYKTLKGVLAASPLLSKHWTCSKNTYVRK